MLESHNSSSMARKNTADKFVILIATNKDSSTIDNLIFEVKNEIPDNIPAEIILIQLSPKTQKNDITPGAKIKRFSIKTQQSNPDLTSMHKSVPVRYIQNNFAGEKIPAILQGLKSTICKNVILMSDDFSDPPQMLPVMMESYINNGNCILIAKEDARTRSYSKNRNLNGNLITSDLRIVENKFNANLEALFSNFVAFPRRLIDSIPNNERENTTNLEIIGFKILEVNYTFTSDTKPKSEFVSLVVDYAKSILYYYKHGTKSKVDFSNPRYKNSVMFISKAIRFYTVGASGFLINYIVSYILSNGVLLDLWYMQATLIGIFASITSNFFLNKAWTFQDRNFSFYYTLRQFLLFAGISCFGALIQLGLVYIGVEGGSRYWTSLLFSIVVASISNFLLNKKFTFNERLWG